MKETKNFPSVFKISQQSWKKALEKPTMHGALSLSVSKTAFYLPNILLESLVHFIFLYFRCPKWCRISVLSWIYACRHALVSWNLYIWCIIHFLSVVVTCHYKYHWSHMIISLWTLNSRTLYLLFCDANISSCRFGCPPFML